MDRLRASLHHGERVLGEQGRCAYTHRATRTSLSFSHTHTHTHTHRHGARVRTLAIGEKIARGQGRLECHGAARQLCIGGYHTHGCRPAQKGQPLPRISLLVRVRTSMCVHTCMCARACAPLSLSLSLCEWDLLLNACACKSLSLCMRASVLCEVRCMCVPAGVRRGAAAGPRDELIAEPPRRTTAACHPRRRRAQGQSRRATWRSKRITIGAPVPVSPVPRTQAGDACNISVCVPIYASVCVCLSLSHLKGSLSVAVSAAASVSVAVAHGCSA
jgi:hypothetical protein